LTPSIPIHLGIIVSPVLTAAWLVGACGAETPAPEPPERPIEISAPLLTPEEGPQLGSLDAFGNLKGSGERVLGFEVPQGADRNQRARAFPVMYVTADEKRLLRFYRSRGHILIKSMTSWTITHSHRTLAVEDDTSRELKAAKIVMSQGPGAGYTLRFHRSSPLPRTRRPIELLVAAERKRSDKGSTGQRTGSPRDAPAPLNKLRSEAFKNRPITPKAVDLSQRIYEHMKSKGGERFLD
jgi:hypothetical protein